LNALPKPEISLSNHLLRRQNSSGHFEANLLGTIWPNHNTVRVVNSAEKNSHAVREYTRPKPGTMSQSSDVPIVMAEIVAATINCRSLRTRSASKPLSESAMSASAESRRAQTKQKEISKFSPQKSKIPNATLRTAKARAEYRPSAQCPITVDT